MSLSISGSSGFLQAQQAQKAQAMFAKLDLNTDGSLSQDEFTAPFSGVGGQNVPEKGSARQLKGGGGFQGFSAETLGALIGAQQMSQTDRSAEIFAGADAEGDGSLTAEELSADMAAHAPPGAEGTDSASRAADFLAAADSDGDGALSSEEFSAMKPQGGPPPGGPPPAGGSTSTAEAEEEKTYDAADTNQDGTVSMSELLASLQSSSEVAEGFSTQASDLMSKLLEQLTADLAAGAEAVTA